MSLVAAREGGQLKAKQDGVVRPGASRLSLPGFGGLVGGGNWSITDQAAAHTRVGIEGRVTPTGQLEICLQSIPQSSRLPRLQKSHPVCFW